MTASKHRDLVVVGALLRRNFRTFLDIQGIAWTERKGLFTSDFIVDATPDGWRLVNNWVAAVKARMSE